MCIRDSFDAGDAAQDGAALVEPVSYTHLDVYKRQGDDWSLGTILVIVPTYNEIENIDIVTSRLRAAVPQAHILVTDDNSPDGTGRRADELAAADDHLHVLHRQGKEGLSAAYLASFRWGLERDYGVFVEFDADGSHQREHLPRLSLIHI